MLAYSIWQDHQDATSIRAVVVYVELPIATSSNVVKGIYMLSLHTTLISRKPSRWADNAIEEAALQTQRFLFLLKDHWLTLLRFGLALQILLYCLSLAAIGFSYLPAKAAAKA